MKLKLLASAALLMTTAFAAHADPIKLGYNGAPDAKKNAVHYFAETLEKIVEEKTDIEIELFPNSQLGSEQERMENTLASPMLNVASFAGLSPVVPESFVSNTPFMFGSPEEARSFFDEGKYWGMVEAAFAERTGGSEILAVVEEGGFLAFTSTDKAIHTPADFDGMKFRAMDPSQVALYEAMGASGTPIPWTEVYSALQTGVVEGQMNPPLYIILGSLNEVQKYMTRANVQYSMQFLVGNGEWLASLSDEDRAVLEAAVVEANNKTRAKVQATVEERVTWLAENGMEVITPTADQLAEFQKIGQPSFINWLGTQSIDKSFIEAAFADLGKSDLLK
ncbi:2,3-diketo-L-gulonate-binding periplasmic protein YiaO precursor [Pelagimonas phthalicica]|uniref:2,3-diketo-L-gulonate-binding periplasmic protein YiaO n=1 Tax=Pelagimonas phthalicica TaxID=1037362 RepID=A0A238JAJ0_9RHOB|nr:TRAP transporter substrate-binding protein DctP [Pelagimonas phthalicica]TDS94249.1 TRAP-type C4-dicarboxylate transport system substrate-binding protein [Pelagimonas phthalicica]SMX27224.1 2,3-diketo-L-gulonate-binding periplasmic protein YiaO precursor [Pelagimonas phthalicica]